MSRLGKLPIALPPQTEARIDGDLLVVKGAKGELWEKIRPEVSIKIADNQIAVAVSNTKDTKVKAMWGLYRSLIKNMVLGVTEGFEKKLEINGVGYRAAVSGQKLVLNVGYSHPVEFELPAGIAAKTEANTITLSGINKQVVGETAAQIRKIRQPEPYKGKGIKYADEIIRRKEGKKAGK